MLEDLKDILWAANPRNRIWPPKRDRDPSVKGPPPRVLSFEAALEIRRRQRKARENGEVCPSAVFKDK